MLESNAVVDEKNGQVHFNMLIDPDRTAGEGFRPRRLGGMLDRMFRRDRYFPEEIARLIDDMIAGKYPSCAAGDTPFRRKDPGGIPEGKLHEISWKADTRKKGAAPQKSPGCVEQVRKTEETK